MTDIIMINDNIKIGTDQTVVTGEISIDKIRVGQDMNRIIQEKIVEAM